MGGTHHDGLGAQSKNEDGSIVQNGKGIWDSTVSASQESWTNQINWIVRKKRKGGMADAQIAKSMNVSVIWVKKLWFRYVNRTGTITYPLKMGQAISRIAKDEYHRSIHGLVQP